MRALISWCVVLVAVDPTVAAERRVSGLISKITCGDGTDLTITMRTKKKLTGVCYENWCEKLCGEKAVDTRKYKIGTSISASVRVINTEESEVGAISNEFFNITLE